MENNKDKYKGFANAAEYIQDIEARYAAFEAKNAEYVAYLKQKEESGEYDSKAYNDPQDMISVGEMIKIIEKPEHEGLLDNEEMADTFAKMKSSSEFYQKNDAFRKEMNDGMALLYSDKIEAAETMIEQMTILIDTITEYIAENGSSPEHEARLGDLQKAVQYLKQDIALSQLQINALQKEMQN